jgi:hypothetical protein
VQCNHKIFWVIRLYHVSVIGQLVTHLFDDHFWDPLFMVALLKAVSAHPCSVLRRCCVVSYHGKIFVVHILAAHVPMMP